MLGVNELHEAREQKLLAARLRARAGRLCLRLSCRALCCLLLLSFLTALSIAIPVRDELTVDELKAKISSTNVADRPHICVQIAQKELSESDRLYASADVDKAQAALTDVVTYSELARDYSLQSHRYQKQAEIAVREMTRKLNQILHTLGHDEQPPVKNAVTRLEHVRDDLLASMFKKGAR
jgi:hypothetical protein